MQNPESPPPNRFNPTYIGQFTSDSLPALRETLATPPFSLLAASILQIRVALDANVVLNELRWVHHKRKKPGARTGLREVLMSGVVIAYAPPQLEDEVARHLGEFSRRFGIAESALKESWAQFRKLIRWIAPRENLDQPHAIDWDPTDAPYVELCAQIGAAGVVTRDDDYESFDVRCLDPKVMGGLQMYARFTAAHLGVKVTALGTLQIAVAPP